MPVFDAYTTPRPPYEECGYNNDEHNAVQACICTMAQRPCNRPMNPDTSQCQACSACGPCAKFYRSQEAKGTHKTFEN